MRERERERYIYRERGGEVAGYRETHGVDIASFSKECGAALSIVR